MFRNQVNSTCAVLSVLGVAVVAAPPAWADGGPGLTAGYPGAEGRRI